MRRARALQGARIGFVLLAIALAWWGFRGRWDEIGGSVDDFVLAAGAAGSVRGGRSREVVGVHDQ